MAKSNSSESKSPVKIFQEVTYCQDVKNVLVKLPRNLESLFAAGKVENSNEALAIALHTLMLEADFIPYDVPDINQLPCLPTNWKVSGIYRIGYYHVTCPDVTFEMTCVPLHSLMAVHGTIDKIESPYHFSITLQVYDYISNQRGFSDPKNVYHHLVELSQMFKDQFVYTLLTQLQNAAGIEPTFGLNGLITDFKFQILDFLPVESLVAISAVNKEFHNLANSSFLWKKLYLRDFPEEIPPTTQEQHKWKRLYKDEYSKQKKLRTMRSQATCERSSSHLFYRHPPWEPRFIDHQERAIDYGIGLAPELQEAFPYLQRRYQTDNPMLRHMISRHSSPMFRYI